MKHYYGNRILYTYSAITKVKHTFTDVVHVHVHVYSVITIVIESIVAQMQHVHVIKTMNL